MMVAHNDDDDDHNDVAGDGDVGDDDYTFALLQFLFYSI